MLEQPERQTDATRAIVAREVQAMFRFMKGASGVLAAQYAAI
jgi:hypothetical protein